MEVRCAPSRLHPVPEAGVISPLIPTSTMRHAAESSLGPSNIATAGSLGLDSGLPYLSLFGELNPVQAENRESRIKIARRRRKKAIHLIGSATHSFVSFHLIFFFFLFLFLFLFLFHLIFSRLSAVRVV